MARTSRTPAYLEIAGDYRAKILDGSLPAGARLPSESDLIRQYQVSRIVAKMAIGVLRAEGLIVSRQGSGSFVKAVRRMVRDSRGRYSRSAVGSTSPFRSDAVASGQHGYWEHASYQVGAPAPIARRLHLPPHAPVMCTEYRYFTESEPLQLATSWEPAELTAGTAIAFPEEGPVIGVIARWDTIGWRIDTVLERVTARAAVPAEATRLELPPAGGYVLVIQRTHFAGDRPLETCDIVFPGDRYELTYRIDVE